VTPEERADLIQRTVAATLRQVAEQVSDRSDRDVFREVAEKVDFGPDAWLCCPVCEESTCDEGCPLEELRAEEATSLDRFADPPMFTLEPDPQRPGAVRPVLSKPVWVDPETGGVTW
jgi:hypothetical protein